MTPKKTPQKYVYLFGEVEEVLARVGGDWGAMRALLGGKGVNLFDASSFYKGTADKDSRSLMNITFNLETEELEKKLVAEATAAGFDGLKGHRSVGGLRASIYNAFPKKGVEDLVSFMKDFQKKVFLSSNS